MDFVIVKVSYF